MKLKIFKETTLPATLEADAIYFILNNDFAETYVTDNSAVAKLVGNSTMITTVANSLMQSEILYAANINDRDTLTLSINSVVYVGDASGDSTVNSGGALYFWDNNNSTYIKISEFESMDLVVNWADIVGRPTSTVAQIDQAVTDAHTHANKAEIDKIGEDGAGDITYNSNPISKWMSINW